MNSRSIGKILYALLFLFILPAGLWYWAELTNNYISWPGITSPGVGIILLVSGFCLILWGMAALYFIGKGLPMNAYPPRKYVTQGPYVLFRHPIYVGFAILILGYGLLSGSASILWLILPSTILGMIALVLGFERIDLNDRFNTTGHTPLFSLPDQTSVEVSTGKKFALLMLVLVSTILCNSSIRLLRSANNVSNEFTGLHDFLPYTPIILTVTLICVFLAPIMLKNSRELRHWVLASLSAILLTVYITLILPSSGGINYSGQPPSALSSSGEGFQRYLSLGVIGVSGLLISGHSIVSSLKRFQLLIISIYGLLTVLLLATCQNSLIHLFAGAIIYLITYNLLTIWRITLNIAEMIANSWHESIIGNIRIINHGYYVGLGAFLGCLLIGLLAGEKNMWGVVIFALVVTICSALWAQLIEGSDKLKRPFGFYGALIGIIFAGTLVWYLGYQVWAIIGATSVAMPWIQGIGRLRCLINGCCHGARIDNPAMGIKYHHYRSRVVTISDMPNEALHPTPVYSIVWLFFCGFILLAMWNNKLSPAFIFGMYLILNGLGRFVEEAYRGEVQTPSANKLRLYQWTAVGSVLCGIIFTCIPIPFPDIVASFNWKIPVGALIIGFFTFFAMGVDFPNSNARFSRLV